MKSIDEINRANVAKISAEKKLPNFFPGDIIKVGVKITEGKRDRIQYLKDGLYVPDLNSPIRFFVLSYMFIELLTAI